MVRFLEVVLVALALPAIAEAAPVRYGSPIGCSGQTGTGQASYLYDGTTFTGPSLHCDFTPNGAKLHAHCTGPTSQYTEDFTVVTSATSVQIFRANGDQLVGLPVCK